MAYLRYSSFISPFPLLLPYFLSHRTRCVDTPTSYFVKGMRSVVPFPLLRVCDSSTTTWPIDNNLSQRVVTRFSSFTNVLVSTEYIAFGLRLKYIPQQFADFSSTSSAQASFCRTFSIFQKWPRSFLFLVTLFRAHDWALNIQYTFRSLVNYKRSGCEKPSNLRVCK